MIDLSRPLVDLLLLFVIEFDFQLERSLARAAIAASRLHLYGQSVEGIVTDDQIVFRHIAREGGSNQTSPPQLSTNEILYPNTRPRLASWTLG